MIQHNVVWKLVEQSTSERSAVLTRFAAELGALVGVVPGLVSVSLTPDVGENPNNFDVSLITIHESRAALATYQSHPDHVAIGTWWGSLVTHRGAVDSEI
ncbi:MAG: Dabb family protein [Microbacteriaceae bacterium]|nr:Dabb family protein [Microbacteriaceae bacterium]